MSDSSNQFLLKENVSTLMKKYSVPCIISLLVAALYNIVDQIFIANASYLGSYGNAANTVVFPLTIVALAFVVMIGDGACAFVSICLGKGQPDEAAKSVGNAVSLSIITGLVMAFLYLVFMDKILTAFGGRVNSETFRLSQEYFFWISLGIPFYVFGQAMNPIIRSDGSPRFAMVSTIAGALFNIIFDPVLIFVFKWGMKGAAIATVAGQIITAGLAVWYLFHMKMVRLRKKQLPSFRKPTEAFPSPGLYQSVLADRIYLCMMVLALVNKGTFIYLQSLGKALESSLLSVFREIVLGVGLALLLPLFFGLDGVLYSMPLSDLLTFFAAFVLIRKNLRELQS